MPGTATAKRPAKKVPPRKRAVAVKPPAAPPAKKKAPAKKAAATKAPVSNTTKKATTTPKRGGLSTQALNVHGFVPGTDSAIIADALIAGGKDRLDVNAKAAKAIKSTNGLKTRSGGDKIVSSLTSGVLGRLLKNGYKIEASWRVVPPKSVQNKIDKGQV